MDVRKWVERKAAIAIGESGTSSDVKLIADTYTPTTPTITELVEAARNFAARVEERNPEWFREERGTTDSADSMQH